MSISAWYILPERIPLMDFVQTHMDYFILVLTPQPPRIDMELFVRPFKDESWIGIASMVFVLLITMTIPFILVPTVFENTTAWRIVYLISMLFFVLINAFYGGAMTMFFTNEISLPFQGLRDVLRSDTWQLVVQEGKAAFLFISKLALCSVLCG